MKLLKDLFDRFTGADDASKKGEDVVSPVVDVNIATSHQEVADVLGKSVDYHLIQRPSKVQVEKMEKNGRVEYFPAEVPDKIAAHLPMTSEDIAGISKHHRNSPGVVFYGQMVTDRLARKIAEEFKDFGKVGIRGISVSVDGEISAGNLQIKNPDAILQDGTELNGVDSTLITALSCVDSETPEIHHRTLQWLTQGAQQLRKSLGKESTKIFPAIIVYDLKHLKPGKFNYEAILPEDKEDRSKCILKIFVLDYPPSVEELS